MSRNAMRKSIQNTMRSKGFEEYLDMLKAKREANEVNNVPRGTTEGNAEQEGAKKD